MTEKINKTLAQEISQDEAYIRSGHAILDVHPVVKGLLPEFYKMQLRESNPYRSELRSTIEEK